MWRALKSGYGHFPRGREGYRTIWRKKKFLVLGAVQREVPKAAVVPFGKKFSKNFFFLQMVLKIFSQRGPLQLLAVPFGQHRGQIFFPKSFFYSLVMWRALKSGYGHFPRGREGYRTIWRKKFENFFPKGTTAAFGTSLWTAPRTNFFSKVFLL